MILNAVAHRAYPGLSCLFLMFLFLVIGNSHAQGFLDKAPEQRSEAELWQDYQGWRQSGQAIRAYQVAMELVTLTESVHGQDSVEFGTALAELGVTEVLLKRHQLALEHL